MAQFSRADLPPGVKRTGGGAFDPAEENVYFIASNVDRMRDGATIYDHILVAVNELGSPETLETLEGWLTSGHKVFLDSGVFNLATQHARAHGLTMDQALGLAPDQVDGFAELFDKYVEIVRRFGSRLWGYTEIDQGGRENKLKTRAKLEALGLAPIPVYHPLNDGWDYFDYLAERYDRVCFGNVVKADEPTRERFLATAWERHRRYPYLWVHLLGFTPNQWLNAFPINSGDASTWLACLRWRWWDIKLAGRPFGFMPLNMRYVLGRDNPDPERSFAKNTRLSAYQRYIDMRVWRRLLSDWEALGCDPYPPPREEDYRGNV